MAAASAGARERRASGDRRARRPSCRATYSPLANAAWRYPSGSGFGWTDVPYDQMQDYVSAQTYALGSAGSHFGFAWAPNRPDGVGITQFATESSAVLDRLAAAIHDPASACAASCTNAIDGASFNEGWKDFATWSTPTLAFGDDACDADRGHGHPALTVRLQLAGITRPDTVPVTVTLSSDSRAGRLLDECDRPVDARRSTCPCPSDRPMRSSTTAIPRPGLRRSPRARRDAPARTSRDGAARRARDASRDAVVRQAQAAAERRRSRRSGTDAFGNVFAPIATWSASNGTVSPATGSPRRSPPGQQGARRSPPRQGADRTCDGQGLGRRPSRVPGSRFAEQGHAAPRLARRRRLPAATRRTRVRPTRAEARRTLARVRDGSHELARASQRSRGRRDAAVTRSRWRALRREASPGTALRRRTASA